MSSVRHYEIVRTDAEAAASHPFGPFAAPTPGEAAMKADGWVGGRSRLRWTSWDLVDFDTKDVVARSSSAAPGFHLEPARH